MKYALPILLAIVLLSACGPSHPALPSAAISCTEQPRLLPDYTEVTVPVNIAPLNFMIDEAEVSDAVLRLQANGFDQTYGGAGNSIIIDEKEWHGMLQQNAGSSITCTLYTLRGENWRQHPAFSIQISPDTIDRYVSYRLIEPSYVGYENIAIRQRELSSFTETTIIDNSSNHKEQCLNCHSYQNYRTDNMLLHIRGTGGGTMLVRNGKPTLRTDLKRDSMMSNPVYPAWHPNKPLIVFSTNKTGQFFHLLHTEKIEVQDSGSALVLYDMDNDRMISIPSSTEDFETFPTWSPDGKYIYYSSMHFAAQDTSLTLEREIADHYLEIHYNLYRRAFDETNLTFSERELVLDLEAMGQSATLPRISPDGRFMLFACGKYGYFHIWHQQADIWKLDLTTGQVDSLAIVNSNRAESYPSWSSTGRWILMASRRNDSNYSRIFMAHMDENGVASKAFELPQQDPFLTRQIIKSYNRPEFMIEPALPLP